LKHRATPAYQFYNLPIFHQVRSSIVFVNLHLVHATTGTRIQVLTMRLRYLRLLSVHDLPYFRVVLFAIGWEIVRRHSPLRVGEN
jgi:hypothetical protein